MRIVLAAVLGALLFCGCAQSMGKRPTRPGSPAGRAGAGGKPTATGVTPAQQIRGKVVSVNSKLRFVVIDFYLSQLPETDQRMNVYRQGQKVAEIKISGPSIGNNIAADVLAGEAQVGDEVRVD